MKDTELLLTDEFVAFSKEIATLHEEKKRKRDEFKALYEQYQSEMAALDTQATEVAARWDAWKKEMMEKPEKAKKA